MEERSPTRDCWRPEGQRMLARNTVVIYGRKALVKDDELDWFDLYRYGMEKSRSRRNPDLVVESGRVAEHAPVQKARPPSMTSHKKLFVRAGTEALALQVDRAGPGRRGFCLPHRLLGRNSIARLRGCSAQHDGCASSSFTSRRWAALPKTGRRARLHRLLQQ